MAAPVPPPSVQKALLASMRARGWALVFGRFGNHPVAYGHTVGLTERFGYPEAVVVGLGMDLTHHVVAELVARLSAGDRPALHSRVDLRMNLPFMVHPVPHKAAEEHLHAAVAYYSERGAVFESVQLVWPDQEGIFPWESGHSRAGNYQPLLSTEPPPNQARS